MAERLRLGVNIDHVATVRNARGGAVPDPVRAAHLAIAAGADGITAHLREDRRHIRDTDMARLSSELSKPLNFEMAATDEMIALAERFRPHAACLVPEKRDELTTEGGLDVAGRFDSVRDAVNRLHDAGIRVSLFIDPDARQIEAAGRSGATVIELHTGAYAEAAGPDMQAELERVRQGVVQGIQLGLRVNAGHGLHYENVAAVAALPGIAELNIGHAIIARAVFDGLEKAVRDMKALMVAAAAPV